MSNLIAHIMTQYNILWHQCSAKKGDINHEHKLHGANTEKCVYQVHSLWMSLPSWSWDLSNWLVWM